MKTLVLANQKGGVGKSAVATLLAHYFAQHGQRVLAIDLDHQGNFSKPLRMSERAAVDRAHGRRVDDRPHRQFAAEAVRAGAQRPGAAGAGTTARDAHAVRASVSGVPCQRRMRSSTCA